MEDLIDAGFIKGVLDLTTPKGVMKCRRRSDAGHHRLEAADFESDSAVVSVGALDMVNFGPFDTVPPQFAKRNLYKHNHTVTLMRTTAEENKEIGRIICRKIEQWPQDNTALFLPLKGVSLIDVKDSLFMSGRGRCFV